MMALSTRITEKIMREGWGFRSRKSALTCLNDNFVIYEQIKRNYLHCFPRAGTPKPQPTWEFLASLWEDRT